MGKQTASQKTTDAGELKEPAAASSETVDAGAQIDAETAGTAAAEDETKGAPAKSKPRQKVKAGDRVDVRVPINGGRTQTCIATVIEPPDKAGDLVAEYQMPRGKTTRQTFRKAGTPGAHYVWSRGGADAATE